MIASNFTELDESSEEWCHKCYIKYKTYHECDNTTYSQEEEWLEYKIKEVKNFINSLHSEGPIKNGVGRDKSCEACGLTVGIQHSEDEYTEEDYYAYIMKNAVGYGPDPKNYVDSIISLCEEHFYIITEEN